MSFGTTLRSLAKRTLPRSLLTPLARVEQQVNAVRFTVRHRGRTDYRIDFDQRSLRKAKAVILWHDDWQQATQATLDVLDGLALVHDADTVVDYGCGIGRITRALRERHNVRVLAVDRSAPMRDHARGYLPDDDLRSGVVRIISDNELMRQRELQGSVQCILMIEVLQHIPEPILDQLLPELVAMLKPQRKLFVLGNNSLDVDRAGNNGSPIEPVLSRHVRIERRDRWTSGFAYARYSFVGACPDR
jgi:2-polyprenyl-3-methyl-5-hydroxy-6-metoxy-1,4-benzoquinol methylase